MTGFSSRSSGLPGTYSYAMYGRPSTWPTRYTATTLGCCNLAMARASTSKYDWVGDALLATLAETAGSAWTPAHQAAWAEAYGAIVALMRAGEAQAAE